MTHTLKLKPPEGTKIAIWGDLHIGVHDRAAIHQVIECFEHEGVEMVIANGDIHDCGAVSRVSGKKTKAVFETGQLAEEAASGREIVQWMTTRRCVYIPGNHEDWINDLALASNCVGTVTVASALGIPAGIEVLDHGAQVRIGSLVVEHGDLTLGRSHGSANLAATILRRYPAQTTIVGHFHRDDYAVHTTPDHAGIHRSFAAHSLGHLSDPTKHIDYAGRHPNWQQGAGIVTVWYDGGKPRFTVQHIVVHRDRRNRPIFEFNGKVYK